MERFLGTDIASAELFFNIFTSGIETFVIPWDQLLYLCHRNLLPGIGTTVWHLSLPLCQSEKVDWTGIS